MSNMYHISRHYLGEQAVFEPRIPVCQNKSERHMSARVCASPTLAQCWLAIANSDIFRKMGRNYDYHGYYFFVYEFNAEEFTPNTKVVDYEATGECISTRRAKGVLVGAFYMPRRKFHLGLAAQEEASVEEALAAYKKYQKKDLLIMEAEIDAMEWQ